MAYEDRLLMDRRRPMAALRDDEDWVVPNRPMAAVWDDQNGDRFSAIDRPTVIFYNKKIVRARTAVLEYSSTYRYYQYIGTAVQL